MSSHTAPPISMGKSDGGTISPRSDSATPAPGSSPAATAGPSERLSRHGARAGSVGGGSGAATGSAGTGRGRGLRGRGPSAASGSMRSASTSATGSSSARHPGSGASMSRVPSTAPCASETVRCARSRGAAGGGDPAGDGVGPTYPSTRTSACAGGTNTARPSRCSTARAKSRVPMHASAPGSRTQPSEEVRGGASACAGATREASAAARAIPIAPGVLVLIARLRWSPTSRVDARGLLRRASSGRASPGSTRLR